MSDQKYDDPPRRCGRKRPGYYAEGRIDHSGMGTLSAWTWLLGTHIDGGINCLTNVPARRMEPGHLRLSLVTGEFIHTSTPTRGLLSDTFAKDMDTALSRAMPPKALFDHVGSMYTPWSFAEEVGNYGVSRRVPEHVAKVMAESIRKSPIAIVFLYDMPLVSVELRDKLMAMADRAFPHYSPESKWLQPTWMQEGFSLYLRDRNRKSGSDHWLAELLYQWHLLKDGRIEDSYVLRLARALFQDAHRVQMPFGASWLNQVSYVRTADDEEPRDKEMLDMGIETIVLGDEESED